MNGHLWDEEFGVWSERDHDEDLPDDAIAADPDEGKGTLPQEYALALELLERTNANAAEFHVHIEHATETDPIEWLFALPHRLDEAELFAKAAKLMEHLLRLMPMSSLQATLPRYLASAGRSEESRRLLLRNTAEEPQDRFEPR